MRISLLAILAMLTGAAGLHAQQQAANNPWFPVLGRPESLDDQDPLPAPLRVAQQAGSDEIILPVVPWENRPRDGARWQGEVELGLNASHGNSRTSNLFNGVELERATRTGKLLLDWKYVKSTSKGKVTEHHALLDVSHHWIKEDRNHGWFASFGMEYDEFRAFDVRTAFNGGRLVTLQARKDFKLLGKFGAGVSREFGSPTEASIPEAVLGIHLVRQLTRWQRITIETEYFADWRDFSEFRVEADIGWEILLNERHDISFKVTALNRYDSTPQGRKANDLDYGLLLVWKF
jgi:putative salt-induced outer membrane protein YdiY